MIVGPDGNRISSKPKRISARYDAALSQENHWSYTDSLNSVAANSPEVRRKLRERSRYETANNSWLNGAIAKLASYTIGTSPSLQLAIGPELERVESLFMQWFADRDLPKALLTACRAMHTDGEAFFLQSSTQHTPDQPVSLDFQLRECDWFEASGIGSASFESQEAESGIRLADDGRPAAYHMLSAHPGGNSWAGIKTDGQWLDASQVCHVYKTDRPEQLRGIPTVTPALPLFSQLRRYTLAALEAAETAANFSCLISQENIFGEDGNVEQLESMLEIPVQRGMMATLPVGTRMHQLKAEQPTSTHDAFTKSLLLEVGAALGLPPLVILGSAAGYNFSSAKLDLGQLERQLECERATVWEPLLTRIFKAWLSEAVLIPGYLPAGIAGDTLSQFRPKWRWQSPAPIDRAKEAQGARQELQNKTTTLAREHAKRGLDWEVELRQHAREQQLIKELGLTTAPNEEAKQNL